MILQPLVQVMLLTIITPARQRLKFPAERSPLLQEAIPQLLDVEMIVLQMFLLQSQVTPETLRSMPLVNSTRNAPSAVEKTMVMPLILLPLLVRKMV